MNCTVIQRRLLSAEQPDRPGDDVESHLLHCPACRAWQRRLVHLERQLPLLPVPPSTTAKEQLIQRLLGRGTTERRAVADPSSVWRSALIPGSRERAQRKLSVAFALAASLLVFALAWWSWPHDSHSGIDTAVREQARLEARLTSSLAGNSTRERVLRLAALAEQVHGEAEQMSSNSERLQRWARFYSRLVSEQLLEQARRLPPADRAVVLETVAGQLSKSESSASRRAALLHSTAPHSAASFQQIASASRNSEHEIRALMKS